jgi:hypothetical protein
MLQDNVRASFKLYAEAVLIVVFRRIALKAR